MEGLETRTLFNATLTSAIAPVSVAPGSAASTVDLTQHFNDPTVPGTAVKIQTDLGAMIVALTDAQTPQTVANFLHYINTNEYNGTIIHRSVPSFVIQGGGYVPAGTHITEFAPVVNEPGLHNVRGTIAMAKLGNNPNSATSEWFVNLADNSANLDAQNGGFTVFGNVVYGTMSVADAIAALPTVDDSAQNGAFTNLPVQNYSGSQTPSSVPPQNMVKVPTVSVVPKLTYSVISDNPSLVMPALSGSNLVLNYGSGTGIGHVTVTATDLAGNTVQSVFAVNVGVTVANLGTGAAKAVHFTNPNGGTTVITFTGPGTAAVSFDGSGLTQTLSKSNVITVAGSVTGIRSITATGTTPASTITVTGGKPIQVGTVTTDGSLKAFNGKAVDLTDDLTAAGNIPSITLHSATGGTITLSGSGAGVTLKAGDITNESLTTAAPVKSITVASWAPASQTPGANAGTISAPTVGTITSKGDLAENITTNTLTTAKAGSITGGTWTVTSRANSVAAKTIMSWTANVGSLGKLAATTIDASTVNSGGNIASVTANALTNSTILAGTTLAMGNTLPTSAAEFTSPSAISTLKVGKGGYVNSNVAASTLGRVTLSSVQTNNTGTPFGLAAHQILGLVASSGGKTLKASKVTAQSTITQAITTSGFTPGDFIVRIV